MKFWSRIAPLLAVAVAGCASGPSAPDLAAYDFEYMARVERAARLAGVDVFWVNPPQRKSGPAAAAGR